MTHDLEAEGFVGVRSLVREPDRRALQVIPGSHRYGRLDADRIAALKTATPEVLCAPAAGDALLMRPLLLHASSKSMSGRRRRILHIEYCSDSLPAGMAWHEAA
jgi:ectoine hydroxylase-related dioxygenase (phytanoyl-CoA dioxygenase family)